MSEHKAGEASPRVPAGDEMMPTLPEPLEGLLNRARTAVRQNGWFDGALSVEAGGPSWLAEQERWGHAAYEAERALRLAILAYPHDAAFGVIARLTDEGIPPKE